ncbi:MAG TPA: hypothetical protein VEZ90_12910 [Blastocatellia bacterium]|nr:hypothetical protein [Blastocatellia bacterium]
MSNLKTVYYLSLAIVVLSAVPVLAQKGVPTVKTSAQIDSRVPALSSDDVASNAKLSEVSGPDGIPLYTPGNLDFALELPSPPNLLEKQALSRRITDSRCFASAGNGVGVFIGYSTRATAYDIKEYTNDFVKEVEARAGLADVKYWTTVRPDSRLGVFGSFRLSGATGELNGIALTNGSRTWVVLTVYPGDKEDAHDLAERILHSISTTEGSHEVSIPSSGAENSSAAHNGKPAH